MTDVAAPAGTAFERLRALIPQLRPSEARVVNALLDCGPDVLDRSVSEIAAAAGVGVATVVRACQSAGFAGFQAAKVALVRDTAVVAEVIQNDVAASDSPAEILAKVAASSADAVSRTTASVSPEALATAVARIAGADRVLCLGVGTSAPLAQDAAYRLLTVGIAAEAPPDVHVQHVRAQLLRPGDVALIVSHTGSTRETCAAAQAAKDAGATTIAVTSFTKTPLTDLADIILVAGGRETSYRVEAMASRFAHLAVLDALLVAVSLRDAERTRPAQAGTEHVLAEHRF
jgi:DNA-binding MurR/RpiR family transcriptional regulator